jgi:hypothetical protein
MHAKQTLTKIFHTITRPYDVRVMMKAAKTGDVDKLNKMLAHGVPVEARNNEGETALMIAAQFHTIPCVEALIAAHADVNAQDRGGFSVLDIARSGTAIGPDLRPHDENKKNCLSILEANGAKLSSREQRLASVLLAAYRKNAP